MGGRSERTERTENGSIEVSIGIQAVSHTEVREAGRGGSHILAVGLRPRSGVEERGRENRKRSEEKRSEEK